MPRLAFSGPRTDKSREACYILTMAQFLLVELVGDFGGPTRSVAVNVDRIRAIDDIRPGHCRLVFAPDHYLDLDGAAADALLASVSGGPVRNAEGGADANGPYSIQLRDSADAEWRDLGTADQSYLSLNCAQSVATNQCPGQKGAGRRHVRVLDRTGKTVWMMD